MKLPTIIVRGNSLSIQQNIENDYTNWLIISESVLNHFDKNTRHNICNCVRNQIQLMVSWEKTIEEQEFVELKSKLDFDMWNIDIVFQISYDKMASMV